MRLHELPGYDIVGLTEVRARSIKKYFEPISASGNTYLSVNTATGGSDRIVLAYNTKRLQLLSGYELHRFGDWLLNSQGDDGKWLRPEELIDSNWSDINPRFPDDQRTDRYPDSILDFIFVAGRQCRSGRQNLGWLSGREIFQIRMRQ